MLVNMVQINDWNKYIGNNYNYVCTSSYATYSINNNDKSGEIKKNEFAHKCTSM